MKKLSYNQKKVLLYAFCFFIWAFALALLAIVIDWKKIILEISTGWGTLALINLIIAKLKRKSMIIWALLTLILGPISTIMLILSNKENSIVTQS
jgi:hypothetical protein